MKKHLFFDIECANSFKGVCKMCSFGYVICDETFNIIEKDDIVMDPEDKFDYYLFKKNSKINLAYNKEYYYMQAPFIEYEKRIKNILTDDYKAIFGFAVKNDLKYVYQNFKRYDLKPIKLKAYDVRELVYAYNYSQNNLKETALALDEASAKRLCAHSSDDDAHLTLNILKSICQDLDVNIEQVIDLAEVKSIEYIPGKKTKQSFNKHKKIQDPQILKNNRLFNSYYDKINENPIKNKYKGIGIAISVEIKKEIDRAVKIAKYLFDHGAVVVKELSLAKLIVAKDEQDLQRLNDILDTTRISLIKIEDVLI